MGFLDLELATGEIPGPTHRSYWVAEGSAARLAAGAYPSRSRPPEPGEMPDVTAALLEAGIDCFVNLTEDQPGEREDWLHRYHNYVAGAAVVVAHPIIDVTVPTVDEMIATLDAIDDHLRTESGAYVHCWGGKGRTGTVVGCWLVRHDYASPEDALFVLDQIRRGDIGAGDEPSPSIPDQGAFVGSWEPGM